MLLALLLPDPCDEHCAAEFKETAQALLPIVQGEPGPKDIDLRNALLRFIGDFANWASRLTRVIWKLGATSKATLTPSRLASLPYRIIGELPAIAKTCRDRVMVTLRLRAIVRSMRGRGAVFIQRRLDPGFGHGYE